MSYIKQLLSGTRALPALEPIPFTGDTIKPKLVEAQRSALLLENPLKATIEVIERQRAKRVNERAEVMHEIQRLTQLSYELAGIIEGHDRSLEAMNKRLDAMPKSEVDQIVEESLNAGLHIDSESGEVTSNELDPLLHESEHISGQFLRAPKASPAGI